MLRFYKNTTCIFLLLWTFSLFANKEERDQVKDTLTIHSKLGIDLVSPFVIPFPRIRLSYHKRLNQTLMLGGVIGYGTSILVSEEENPFPEYEFYEIGEELDLV